MLKNKEFQRIILVGSACTLVLSACGFFLVGRGAGLLVLVLGLVLTGLFVHGTKKRYLALEDLNRYLTGVLAGREDLSVEDQEEGELSILRSNIYKATTRLRYQKELIDRDRTMLADAMADISHQLKTPLTSMMVMNDLLMSEDDPDRQKQFLQTQSAQLDRMNWLIQTLLKLSKLDAGAITLKQEEVSSGQLIADALKPFEIQMELQEIRAEVSGPDILLRCDRNWTAEALQNIIKNCCEHMDRGGMLQIRTLDTNLFGQITITDTGCGIPEEDLPHIFERFYKGKKAGKDSVGIGLALAKAIMEGQRDQILVESQEGMGSSFHLRFYKTII